MILNARRSLIFGLALLAVNMPAMAWGGKVLDSVRSKGFVQCGVSTGTVGFSVMDSSGKWSGIDIQYCRALAAAVFHDPTKVKYTPLSTQQRLLALQTGEVDILSRQTTWTLTRDASLGLHFVGIVFYDGQGFLVPKKLGVKTIKDLDGAAICVEGGTTTELNLADYFRSRNLSYEPVVYDSYSEVISAFFNERCQAYTGDFGPLSATRINDAPNPEDYELLSELISKEPLSPVVARGDDEWFAIARWVLFAALNAEEMGVTSDNVDKMKNSKISPIQRLLGVGGNNMGDKLNLKNDWAYHIIKHVGNYGEWFDRTFGPGTPFNMKRGVNALWTDGGLMYAPPIR